MRREIDYGNWSERPQRDIITPSLFNDVPNGLQRIIAANQMSRTGNCVLEGCVFDGSAMSEGWALVNGKIVHVLPESGIELLDGDVLAVNDEGDLFTSNDYNALSENKEHLVLYSNPGNTLKDIRPGMRYPSAVDRHVRKFDTRVEGTLGFSHRIDPDIELVKLGIMNGDPGIHVHDGAGNDAYMSPTRMGVNDTTFLEKYDVHLRTGSRIHAPLTNTLTIHTSGTERLRVNSSGNVGIGKTNPLYKLDVDGTVNTDMVRTETVRILADLNDLYIDGTTITFRDSVGLNPRGFMTSEGLGIGRMPERPLDVDGDGRFDGDLEVTGDLHLGEITIRSNLIEIDGDLDVTGTATLQKLDAGGARESLPDGWVRVRKDEVDIPNGVVGFTSWGTGIHERVAITFVTDNGVRASLMFDVNGNHFWFHRTRGDGDTSQVRLHGGKDNARVQIYAGDSNGVNTNVAITKTGVTIT